VKFHPPCIEGFYTALAALAVDESISSDLAGKPGKLICPGASIAQSNILPFDLFPVNFILSANNFILFPPHFILFTTSLLVFATNPHGMISG
jgi:hypothetical protein